MEIKNELPLIDKKFKIEDFQTLFRGFDTNEQLLMIQQQYKKEQKINGNDLIYILFDFIKRKLKFDEIVLKLQEINFNCKITNIHLFNYMIMHSDDDLRYSIFIVCQKYMPIPLLSWNCWENNEDGSLKIIIWNELFYIFEKTKSILVFKISQEQTQGCTQFTNQLFGKDFSQQGISNQKSIEIQFDYDCESINYVVVAQIHGVLDQDIVEKLFYLFDGFIIHSNQNEQSIKNFELISQQIKTVNRNAKIVQIIQNNMKNDQQLSNQNNLNIFKIKNFKDLTDVSYKNLTIQVQKCIIEFYDINFKLYQENPNQRINSKKQIIQFIDNFNHNLRQDSQFYLNKLDCFIDLIKNQTDFTSQEFLPLLKLVYTKSDLQNQLSQQKEFTQIQREKLHLELKSINEQIKNCQPTEIVNYYVDVIQSQFSMKITSFLSTLMKEYIESLITPLTQERSLKKEQYGNLHESVIFLDNEIKKKMFSQEFISREIYHYSVEQKQNKIYKNLIQDHFKNLIYTSQPFEIIDGDTLEFIQDIFDHLFFNDDSILLVVSVIGPQSSGKSFVLNYLFGTFFMSSAGRCTKGVYGSVLKLKCTKTGKNFKILILDTEGIQSAEKDDPKFDRRIIYYIFCISHVVLLCNNGQINQQMSKTVQLVADAIQNTQEDLIDNPSLFILMNMMQQSDERAKLECIDQLQNELNLQNEESQTKTVFQLDPKKIFVFGRAFQQIEFGPDDYKKNIFKTDSRYSREILELRKQIENKIDELENQKNSQFKLKDWIKFAKKTWYFTLTFSQLNDYQDLKQKREDLQLIQKIEEIVQNQLVLYWKQNIKTHIKSELENIFRIQQGGSCTQFEIINNQIQQKINLYYNQIQKTMIDEYEKFCQNKSISFVSRDNRKIIFDWRTQTFKQMCIDYFRKQINDFTDEKAKQVGLAKMNQIIRDLTKQNQQYNQLQANQQFEKAWQEVRNDIKNVLKPDYIIQQDIFNRTRNEFTLVTINVSKQNMTEDIQWYEMFNKYLNNNQAFLDFTISKLKNDFFNYIGNIYFPDIKKINQFQNVQKTYLNQYGIDRQLIKQDIQFQFYDYKKAIKDFINLKSFEEDICQILIKKKSYKGIQIKDEYRIEINHQDNQFFQNWKTKLNKQLQQIEIQFKADLQQFLPKNKFYNQTIVDVQKLKKEIKKQFQLIFDDQNNFQYQQNSNIQISKHYNQLNFDLENYKIYSQNSQNDGYIFLQEKGMTIISENFDIQIKQKQNIKIFLEKIIKLKQIDPQTISLAKIEFFDFIDFEKLFNDIQIEIIKNYRQDTSYHNKNIFDYIQILKNSNDQEQENIAKDFSRLIKKQINSIVQGTKNIIQKLNEELKYFCMQVSTQGQYRIYLTAQTLTNGLATFLEQIYENLPLKKFDLKKQLEKESFVAKLTQNNVQMDKSLAKNFINDILEYLYKKSKEQAQNEFKTNMQQEKKNFIKLTIFNEIDNELLNIVNQQQANQNFELSQQDKKLIDNACQFFINPINYLEKEFEQKFGQTIENFVKKSQEIFKDSYQNKILNLFNYLDQILKQCINKNAINPSSEQFIFKEKELDLNNLQKIEIQKKAAVFYIRELIEFSWVNQKDINIDGKILNQKGSLPIPADLKEQLDEKTKIKILSFFELNQQINNMSQFFRFILENLQNQFEYLQNIQDQNDLQNNINQQEFNGLTKQDLIGDYMIEFKLQFMGCKEHCPLCRRQCDIQHQNDPLVELVKHGCQSGHQIQGFGGGKNYDDKKALTISCAELLDNDIISLEGQDIKWFQFKNEKFNNWNFDADLSDQQIFKEKTSKIWNLLGPQICQQYENKGKQIKFQKAIAQIPFQIQKTHLILMLDASGSMRGQLWENLLKCVEKLFKSLESNVDLKNNVKISVITYDHKSQIIFQKETPSQLLVNQIKFTDGATNFANPLKQAYELCQKSNSEFQKFILFFMTDGDADYPTEEVNKLASFEQDKIDFQGVGFGYQYSQVLRQITQAFKNGQMNDAPNLESLYQSFRKIEFLIYNNENEV